MIALTKAYQKRQILQLRVKESTGSNCEFRWPLYTNVVRFWAADAPVVVTCYQAKSGHAQRQGRQVAQAQMHVRSHASTRIHIK
jgi:hypothetical protein